MYIVFWLLCRWLYRHFIQHPVCTYVYLLDDPGSVLHKSIWKFLWNNSWIVYFPAQSYLRVREWMHSAMPRLLNINYSTMHFHAMFKCAVVQLWLNFCISYFWGFWKTPCYVSCFIHDTFWKCYKPISRYLWGQLLIKMSKWFNDHLQCIMSK